jgi:hypothetical protein
MNFRIVTIPPSDVQWPFASKPHVLTRPQFSYPRAIEVDPFPAYPHDAEVTAATAERAMASFPIRFLVTLYILPHEMPGRTNGHANQNTLYKECDCAKCRATAAKENRPLRAKDGFEPWIVMPAKRIPPHPAMTRYLVAHEYGHIVQKWMELQRGMKDEATTELDREYMALRPASHKEYGGGRWHGNIGELFANDFRILVTGVESEFWPHPGFPRPEEVPAVCEFWRAAVQQFAVKETD